MKKETHIEIENKSANKSGLQFLVKNNAADARTIRNKHALFFIMDLFAGIIKAIAG